MFFQVSDCYSTNCFAFIKFLNSNSSMQQEHTNLQGKAVTPVLVQMQSVLRVIIAASPGCPAVPGGDLHPFANM